MDLYELLEKRNPVDKEKESKSLVDQLIKRNEILLNENKALKKKIDNLEFDVERLESIIYKAVKFLRENACIDKDVEYFCSDLRYDDCKKLLNILKGSDKE